MAEFKDNILDTLTSKRTIKVVVQTRYLFAMDSISILSAFVMALLIRYESISMTVDMVKNRWYVLAFWLLITLGFKLALWPLCKHVALCQCSGGDSSLQDSRFLIYIISRN